MKGILRQPLFDVHRKISQKTLYGQASEEVLEDHDYWF